MFILGVSAAACGDDEPVTPPGDGPCVGHLCEPGLGDAEGGNVIFEYIYFDTQLQAAFQLPNGITTAARIMGYFMTEHPTAQLPTPGQCNNLEATDGWPLFVAQQRTDVDVGTLTITGQNAANTAVTIDVPKQAAGNDAIGRPHDIFYQTVIPDADTVLKPNSEYDVRFGGAAGGLPATTFDNAIFLAGDFTVNNPDIEGDGPLVAGTDFPVAWTPGTTSAPDTVLGITWLVDSNGKPTHMCPVEHSAGQFTIPGQAITEYRQIAQARGTNPDVMILLRNAIIHRISRLPNADDNTPRRIDMLSVLCWAQLMNVSAP